MSHESKIPFLAPMPAENRVCCISGHDLHTVPLGGLCYATYMYGMSKGYSLTIFSKLYNFLLNKIMQVLEPENLYEISQPPPASAWRPHGKGNMGRIQAP